MPSDFTGSPKVLKGALVAFQSQFLGPIPNVIVFQYNCEELSRSLEQRSAPPEAGNVGAAREDVQKVLGPPVENINIKIELNAADQLAEPQSNPQVAEFGLHPSLAALELLLYPPTTQVLLNRTLALAGTAHVCPADVPLVLFIWGRSRVVPVRLSRFSVTEQAFDTLLNPIRATVDLGMRVLTYMELKENNLGYGAYIAFQTQKEVLARLNLVNSAQQIVGMLPF
jgi:hypothetical protein